MGEDRQPHHPTAGVPRAGPVAPALSSTTPAPDPAPPAPAPGGRRAEPAERTREEFQTAFWEAKRAMATAAEAAYNRHGVRAGQQFILRCLWETDGLTPGEIARQLELATPTVTRAATRMEAAGLLRRAAHPTDARLVRLLLTDRGHELEGVIAEEMRRLNDKALRTLDPAERALCVRFLREIRQNVTR